MQGGMGEVLGIDITSSVPVEPLSHYGEVNIHNTGKVRPTEPLPDDVIDFLKKIKADVSLWDGTLGVLGRDYITNKTPRLDLTREEIEDLRSQYKKVKQTLASPEMSDELKKELEMHIRMQRQLDMSVFEIEQEVDKLRKEQGEHEIENGEQSEAYKAVETRIENLLSELQPCKEAETRIQKKVQQTRVDVAESETGFFRRISLLGRIFASENIFTVVGGSSEKDETIAEAKKAEQEACNVALKLQQSKRFYVDARTGMAHLYKIENMLKTILEHLKEGMNSLQGRGDTARKIPLETGFEFRIGYVRKLWSRADTCFKQALPYIKGTSLRQARATCSAMQEFREPPKVLKDSKQWSGSGSKAHKLSRLSSGSGSGSKKFGIFESAPTLLPSFTRVEFSHPISRKSRITALHKSAASAYRDMNELYDFHEKMTKEAFALLQTMEREDQQVNDVLIEVWERLLERPLGEQSGPDC